MVNETEIRAHGKMYDIIKKQIVKSKIFYYAIADNDEDEYAHQLTDLEKNNTAEKSLPGKTAKAFEAKYFSVINNNDPVTLSLDRLPDEQALNKLIRYLSISKDIFSPPPNQ